jgi:hypothetical protein
LISAIYRNAETGGRNLELPKVFIKTSLVFSIFLLFSFAGPLANAADKENCLMCHKYTKIGRIDEKGSVKSYFVSENIYANTVHRNVPCRDCHTYIDKLPHDPITKEVDCANECHIKPPFSKENFSHKKIIEVYDKSVHGIKEDDTEELKVAKPYCKYCHVNPEFTKVEEERIAFEETLKRCLNCHERKGVTQAYKHITHRLRHKTSRTRREVVMLCAKNCHADIELMKKLNVSKESLEAVETYTDSIHGKAVALGSEETADCVSCHATSAIHDIYKKDEKKSTVHKDNIANTCRQCHEEANEKFVQIDVHSAIEPDEKPLLYSVNVVLTFVFYGSVFGLIGLALLESYGRRKDGIAMQIIHGTSWRGISKRRLKK